jgi:hypothetical protein
MRILTGSIGTALAAACTTLGGLTWSPPADAARCSVDSGNNASCSYAKRYNGYWCNGAYVYRAVRWQVPEGTPPSGGWPVAFFYAGTQLSDTDNAFIHRMSQPYGQGWVPHIIREMLDNPNGTGRKYAVFVADPPASGGWLQYWHTNVVYPYSASCDYDFFPDFFGEIAGGSYGAASQYNLSKRYAFGLSSGGFNSSRMAVTFNGSSVWKALGIVAASYATCSSSCGTLPTLPANHPPTKFWHGQNDSIVPLTTMYAYYNKLGSQGLVRAKLEHGGGHEVTVDTLGVSGIKAWFDGY